MKKSFKSDGTKAYNTYYEYNELGDLKEYRLETADGVILSREKHAYDGDGNTTIITYNDGSKHSFQYDLASRLKNEQKISSNGAVLTTISYQYDSYGNRLSITKNGTTTTYKYDSANQISSVNGSAGIYQYDQNGNQIRDDRHKYYYDSSNRLSYVEQANAAVAIASYSYDYEGKRTKKAVYGKKTEQYYYDAGHLTYIADENNQILYSFTRTYTGDLVTMTDYTSGTAVNYYYVHNGHGDIIGLKDKTGTTVVTYEYDAFGNIITSTGTTKTGNGRLLREENPFRYASYFYDEETKLYYLRMRYYDPSIGRYLTRDIMPSANLYVYTENNPVRFIDPLGLALYPIFMSPIEDKIPKVNRAFQDYFYVGGTTKKGKSKVSNVTSTITTVGVNKAVEKISEKPNVAINKNFPTKTYDWGYKVYEKHHITGSDISINKGGGYKVSPVNITSKILLKGSLAGAGGIAGDYLLYKVGMKDEFVWYESVTEAVVVGTVVGVVTMAAPPVGLALGLFYSIFSGLSGYSVGEEIWR
ncbi:RHS repeat domain-containing protein [Schinkia azotoformans]|uniref:RHS repeat domain-containing protein n=1 Tax=Schinkia azotoformans TaxID=1454 RepID=UPI002DB74A62|nr:RHS repeat-associated core domain-containing protein [Schinkia azotoformans]MEC1772372.1 RHS repeat-associated core domain-containing protein [Schinkia azotoformans]MED4365867.1 RHS repeat-associated core domain-containing protein [Schinkia azotoformans]